MHDVTGWVSKVLGGAAWLVAALCLVACPAARTPDAAPEKSLFGRVVFPRYRAQALIEEVATAATVSVIDPVRNETVATSLTDAQGRFRMGFKKQTLANQVYYLEAVKGLSSNAVGKDAVRVRTFIQYQGGGWRSLTSAAPGFAILINQSTTALCLMVSLRESTSPVDPLTLLGRLYPGVPAGDSPDTFVNNPGVTGVQEGDFASLRALVATLLADDRDPFDGVRYENGAYDLKIGFGASLSVTDLDPALATAGDTVSVRGSGFTASASVVFSPAATADLLQATPTALKVRVPQGAATGEVRVSVGGQSATASFTLVPLVSGGLQP
ncbi:MAG TPA: IPT/TIG domain-containing protein [Pantanalinema sp.]